MELLPDERVVTKVYIGRRIGEVKPEDKGAKGKNCNRTACQQAGGVYQHRGNGKYYCPACAFRINDANIKECRELFGHDDLCTRDAEAVLIARRERYAGS